MEYRNTSVSKMVPSHPQSGRSSTPRWETPFLFDSNGEGCFILLGFVYLPITTLGKLKELLGHVFPCKWSSIVAKTLHLPCTETWQPLKFWCLKYPGFFLRVLELFHQLPANKVMTKNRGESWGENIFALVFWILFLIFKAVWYTQQFMGNARAILVLFTVGHVRLYS